MVRNGSRLVCCPSYSGLEAAFIEHVRALKAADPLKPVVAVVRSGLAITYLRRLLAERIGGHANVHLVTLEHLAGRLAAPALLATGARPLPDYAREALAGELTASMGLDSYFGEATRLAGFPYVLAATIDDLRQAGLNDGKPLRRTKSRKLAELADAFEAYLGRLGESFCDEARILQMAAAADAGGILGCDELVVYGFYDFTNVQRRFIEALSQRLPVVALVPFADGDGYAYAQPTVRWLRQIGFRVSRHHAARQVADACVGQGAEGRGLLAAAVRNLFTHGGEAAHDDGSVRVLSCATDSQEAEEIARAILELVRHEGAHFQDFGVIVRDLPKYAMLLSEVFERAGIPYFLAQGEPVSFTAWGRGLLKLVSLADSGGARAAVMEFLTGAPIRFEEILAREVVPSEWDAISKEAGISRGWDQWHARLTNYIASLARHGDNERAAEAEALRDMVARLAAGLASLPSSGTWREFSRAVEALADEYLGPAGGRDECLEMLRKIRVLGDHFERVRFDEFRRMLSAASQRERVRVGRFGEGAVTVVDVMAARAVTFDCVFIPGVTEGGFPQKARHAPLLTDSERRLLNMSTAVDRAGEERMLFCLALSSARRKVFVSFPRADSTTGRPRGPSNFVTELARVVSGRRVPIGRLGTVPGFSSLPASRFEHMPAEEALDEMEFDLVQAAAARRRASGKRLGYLAAEKVLFRRALGAQRARYSAELFTPYEGVFKAAEALQELRAALDLEGELAVTSLEDYARCPFRYYLERLLGVKEPRLPEDEVEVPSDVRGRLVHGIMAHFFSGLRQERLLPIRREKLLDYHRRLRRIEGELFAEHFRQNPLGLPLLWRVTRDRIRRTLKAYVDRAADESGDMIPTSFEVNFGSLPVDSESEGGSRHPVEFQVNPERVLRFRGRIDRIDLTAAGDGFRVIDYKTGKRKSHSAKGDIAKNRVQLQLVVYVEAASRILGLDVGPGCVAQYLYLSPGSVDVKPQSLSGDDWGSTRAQFTRFVDLLTASLESGAFLPVPVEQGACRFCPCRLACRSAFLRKDRPKEATGAARDFLTARDGGEGDG